jgi:hypothetical protein
MKTSIIGDHYRAKRLRELTVVQGPGPIFNVRTDQRAGASVGLGCRQVFVNAGHCMAALGKPVHVSPSATGHVEYRGLVLQQVRPPYHPRRGGTGRVAQKQAQIWFAICSKKSGRAYITKTLASTAAAGKPRMILLRDFMAASERGLLPGEK